MAYFEKFLTPVDVKKQVAIPSDFVKHLPEYKGGRTINFPVRDVAGNVWENFGKQVAIPTDFVRHLPDYEGGHTITFPVRDVSGKVWENFGYYIRREGNDYPKPVFQKD
ncbi:hypothetical protein V6N13_085310 [Hibiscus sabdariffa]